MKKLNPSRYSSAVGDIWVMATFKVKYCHKIFDVQGYRELTDALLHQAFSKYKITCRKLAFVSDHVHIILEMGLYSKIEIAKKIRGYVGRKLLDMLPLLKKDKFWGSGLWNPAYDIRNISDMNFYERYLDKQKYASAGQTMLSAY